MTPQEHALSPDVWSRYWQTGTLHSCVNAYAQNYDGELYRFWAQTLAELPESAVVLDIGTGNGALALIAAEIGRNLSRRWEVHGVDAAHIDPASRVPADKARFDGIQFHPDTPASSLPFGDASVGAVIGQYAFEYMPRAPVLAELSRVCARNGVVGFVMHSTSSVVCRTSAEELANTRLIFEGTRLFERAAEMVDIFVRACDPQQRQRLSVDSAVQARRRAFNRAAAEISDRIGISAEPELLQLALGHVRRAFDDAQAGRREGAIQSLAFGRTDLWDAHCRLRDLVASALDSTAVDTLIGELEQAGFERISVAPIEHSPGRELGWALRATRQ